MITPLIDGRLPQEDGLTIISAPGETATRGRGTPISSSKEADKQRGVPLLHKFVVRQLKEFTNGKTGMDI